MDYSKHYNLLIEGAKNRLLECYIERHHVIPRCMGGNDVADNIVELTAEEHYVAHQLLVKIYPKNYRLAYAANAMSNLDFHGHRSKNKSYGWIRKRVSDSKRGKTWDEMFGEEKANNMRNNHHLKDKPKTQIHRERISKALTGRSRPELKGRKQTEQHKKKRSLALKGKPSPHKGRTLSKEHKSNLSLSLKGKKTNIIYCNHCDRNIAGPTNYKRWHGDNCKENMI